MSGRVAKMRFLVENLSKAWRFSIKKTRAQMGFKIRMVVMAIRKSSGASKFAMQDRS